VSLLVSPQIKTRTRVATKKHKRHKGKVTSRTLFVHFVPFCGDAYLLIRRVLPPPLIDRLRKLRREQELPQKSTKKHKRHKGKSNTPNPFCAFCAFLWRCLFINPSRAPTAANRSTHLARNQLSFRKHTQKILAEDLANVLLAVAAL